MNQDDMEALRGQVKATSMVLLALAQTLSSHQAAQAAVALAIEMEAESQHDQDGSVSPHELSARGAISNSFLALLQAISSRR